MPEMHWLPNHILLDKPASADRQMFGKFVPIRFGYGEYPLMSV